MKPMNPDTWSRVRVIFREAVELDPGQRAAFLDDACREQVELRAEVESLLDADETAGDFLVHSAGEYAAELLLDEGQETDEELEAIPPYVLRGVLGRGGMGTVYLAERDDGQFDQQVALKLIPRHRADPELARRFLVERQILASLVHRGIARLYDGGVTQDGRPYFAMEYVEGEAITRYSESRQLDVESRLKLFEDVCQAVEYAQQRLVVHRDLKPNNILVNAQGEVKLLDFGIAKLLDDPMQKMIDQTQDAARMLTPEYSAPEQLRGEPVSTATDVYALGAILYELLSGRKPHGQGLVDVVSRRLGDGETTRLSQVVENPRLRRQLKGDLENIVAKALEAQPELRYPTAAALLDDLRRHRKGLPVLAAAPTWRYRSGKFLRRHALALGAATLIVLTLVGGSGAVLWQSRIAAREAQRATEVKDFLLSIFSARDPAESGGEDVAASVLLTRGSERVRRELADDPPLQAEMLRELGRIHSSLGDYPTAREHYADALDILETSGVGKRERAQSLVDLATVAVYDESVAEAESLLRVALPLVNPRSKKDAVVYSSLISSLASALRMQGRFDEAAPLFQEALDLDQRLYGQRSLEAAKDLANLAVYLDEVGNSDESVNSLRQVLEIRQERLPPEHPDIASSLHNLGEILRNAGNIDESESVLREAVRIRRKIYAGSHPRLSQTIRSLGRTLQSKDDFAGAEEAYQECYAMSRELLGDQSQAVALVVNDLATIAFYRGDLVLAARRFRNVADTFEADLSPSHPTVLTVRSNIATIELQRGAFEAAEAVYEGVLQRRREQFDADHPSVSDGIRNVAIARRLQGRPSAATPLYREVLQSYDTRYGPDHQDTAGTRTRLAEALCDQGQYSEAEAIIRAGVESFARIFPDGHRRQADALLVMGRILMESDQLEPGFAAMKFAEQMYLSQVGVDHRESVLTRCSIAACQLRLGNQIDAKAGAMLDVPKLIEAYPDGHPDRARLLVELRSVVGY